MTITELTTGQTWGDTRSTINDNTKTLANKQVNTVVLLGDSITEACTPYDTGTATGIRETSWFEWCQAMLDHRFTVVNYAGVGGERLSAIEARLATDVIAYAPKYCIVAGGVNSIGTEDTAADMKASWTNIVSQLRGASIIPIIFSVFPSSDFTTAAEQEKFWEVNQWLKDNSENLGYYFIDAGGSYLDGTAAGPYPATGYVTDAVHPNCRGAYTVAKAIKPLLEDLVPYGFTHRITSNVDKRLISTNPLMSGTTGSAGTGASGDVADGYVVSATNASTVCAKVDRSLLGSWQKFTTTYTANGGSVSFSKTDTGISGEIGETSYAVADIEFNSVSSPGPLVMDISFFNESSTKILTVTAHKTSSTSDLCGFATGDKFTIKTKDFVVPAETSFCKMYLFLYGQDEEVSVVHVSSFGIIKKA